MENQSLIHFRTTLIADKPPENLSVYAESLWWAGKGNWKAAHDLVQDLSDRSAARIHAYLHRLEGDISNAGYWYAKANEKMPAESTDKEWADLVLRFV